MQLRLCTCLGALSNTNACVLANPCQLGSAPALLCVLQVCPVSLVTASHLGAGHIPFELGCDTPQITVGVAAYRAMTTVLQSADPEGALKLLWGPRETSGKMGGHFSLGSHSPEEEWVITSKALASLSPGARLAAEALQRFAVVANETLRGHGVAMLQAVRIESAHSLEVYRSGNHIAYPEHIRGMLPSQFVQQKGQGHAQQQLRAVSADPVFAVT